MCHKIVKTSHELLYVSHELPSLIACPRATFYTPVIYESCSNETSHELVYMSHAIMKTSHELVYMSHAIMKTSHELVYMSHAIMKTSHELLYMSQAIIKTSHELLYMSHKLPSLPSCPHVTFKTHVRLPCSSRFQCPLTSSTHSYTYNTRHALTHTDRICKCTVFVLSVVCIGTYTTLSITLIDTHTQHSGRD